MEYNIRGTVLQMLDVSLSPGEAIYTQAGGMAWMRGPIEMNSSTRGGALKALARVVSGESLFLTTYRAQGDAAITFVPSTVGRVVPVPLGAGQSLICSRDAFLCAQDTVTLEIFFKPKLGVGMLGGVGFVLQKISGPGTAFLEIAGEVAAYELAAGEMMKADGSHIAFFEPTVTHNIEFIKGWKNWIGGGEGLALATLTGPGKVWMRSMPTANLAGAIAPYLPTKG